MEFRIADTFTAALHRLTAQEQKAVKTTAFDLQLDPTAPGLRFHRIDHARDPNFWSLRVNADIRLIVHKSASSLLLVHVDHHDAAYRWAERRRIERHPTTGAMQLVEIREQVVMAEPRAPIVATALKPKVFGNLRKFELMAFGVPEDWVEAVREADEDSLLDVIGHLPQEAQEALLRLAVGERPEPAQRLAPEADPFTHPDALRRFRVLTDSAEMERALAYPWERWAVFLHPDQRLLAERRFNGAARVSGSAGTGKTIVALHRAVNLARRSPDRRVLLTTFSTTLGRMLKAKLAILVGNEPELAGRITVEAVHDLARRLYAQRFAPPHVATAPEVASLLAEESAQAGKGRYDPRFLANEWTDVVDAWNLSDWESYRDVTRLGRKTRIGGRQREELWAIFASVRRGLADRGLVTMAGVLSQLSEAAMPGAFDHVVADEAQDLGVAEMRFLAALAAGRPDGLFLAGDLGQRIFQMPFSWKSLGVDVRGRSQTLRINYRTSHQIRQQADRLLPKSLADVDGLVEGRQGTISVFNGPPPEVHVAPAAPAEADAVGAWLAARIAEGYRPSELGVIVRSDAEIDRARGAAARAGLAAAILGSDDTATGEAIAIGTMHLAKGLEFRGVAVMACDDDILPLPSRIEAISDEADLEEVYETERHLLYVACTRARDRLLVSAVAPGSEFLADLK